MQQIKKREFENYAQPLIYRTPRRLKVLEGRFRLEILSFPHGGDPIWAGECNQTL